MSAVERRGEAERTWWESAGRRGVGHRGGKPRRKEALRRREEAQRARRARVLLTTRALPGEQAARPRQTSAARLAVEELLLSLLLIATAVERALRLRWWDDAEAAAAEG